MMPRRSIQIGKIAGIPIGIQPWWLIMVAVITWSLGSSYFPSEVPGISSGVSYLISLGSVLLLYASIIAHEFGHAIVARRKGIEIEGIDLWLLGGVAKMKGEAKTPGDEFRYAAAGPAVTVLIVILFLLLYLLLPSSTSNIIAALIAYQLIVNVFILAFNLIPAFPLDGGRILRSLMWRHSNNLTKATENAALIGRNFGFIMVTLGILVFFYGYLDGLWLILVGFFLVSASASQAIGAKIHGVLDDVIAHDIMARHVVSIPATMDLDQAIKERFKPYRYTTFPVIDSAGKATGILTMDQIQDLMSAHQHTNQLVADISDNNPDLIIKEDEPVSKLLECLPFIKTRLAAVVDDDGAPIGVISTSDIQRALRAASLRDGQRS